MKKKVAVVAGGAGRIGFEICRTFCESGMSLVILGSSKSRAIDTARKLEKFSDQCLAIGCNVVNSEDVHSAMEQAADYFGGIDVVVSMQGWPPKKQEVTDISDEYWNGVISSHLTGSFHLLQQAIPFLEKSTTPRVIFLASSGMLEGEADEGLAYAVAKGGIVSLTYSAARLLAHKGITVNCIATGEIYNVYGQDDEAQILKQNPLGRIGTSGEVAKAVRYLVGDEARLITGKVLNVTGNLSVDYPISEHCSVGMVDVTMGNNYMEVKPTEDKLWNRNYISILIANCFISISFFILNPTFPVYVKSLIDDLSIVGLLSSLFLISAMLIRPFSGYLTDIYNKRMIFIGGLLLLCISIVGYIFVKSIAGIIVARLLHGIGMGLATTAFGALASQNIPPERMGEGMGYYGLGMVFGMSIGPSIGLQLMNSYNAQVAFGVAGGFSIIGVVVLVSIYRKKSNLNVNMPRPGIPRNIKAFFNIEKSAIIPASLIFFIGIIVSAITTYLALYSYDRGITNIGYFFTIQSGAVLLSRLINGRIADKRGYAIVIIPSIACLAGAMLLLFFAKTSILFMLTAFLYGLGYGTLTSSCQALSVLKANPERRGLAISTYYLGMDAGNGIGTILCGVISKTFGYAAMYLLCIIPLFIGLVIFLFGEGVDRKRGYQKKDILA